MNGMERDARLVVVLVTAPDRKVARALAKKALSARLIACANLVAAIESHYWWKGKLELSKEVLLILKTTKARVRQLERLILKLHPYDTAEFVVLNPTNVTEKYLRWAQESTGS
jgi:periplasmic divalent cation tolerance protein